MPRLTDTQLVILSTAAQRADRAILPPPKSLRLNKGAVTSVLKSLIRKGLAEERPAAAGAGVWREEKDGSRLTLVIAEAGLAAIGVDAAKPADAPKTKVKATAKAPRTQAAKPPANDAPRPGTKQALLVDLLKRKSGVTLDEAVEATGWQPHSVRGAISGTLHKKLGLSVSSEKVEGRGRVYRIAAQA
ncbi:DUF3489 domain-containing protein [Oceanibacterium hippocampi]|uniref:DUF3489 domain-containing protein n=1 Tax=Oceanibacterium hippocampi TaxID=745714 RepID=A0A1Y5U4F2_9PROT|nr:DUF3489 domain-containing protein [Oceanibacterium hippocampi]SLN77033.1 hypothetical protein OCH7691_04254 [Oceanibacterium hippocampi]